MSTDTETYSVYQFLADDTYLNEGSYLPGEIATKIAMQLIRSIGATIGTTKRVIITDGGDSIVFEWKHGEGIVFPEQLRDIQ